MVREGIDAGRTSKEKETPKEKETQVRKSVHHGRGITPGPLRGGCRHGEGRITVHFGPLLQEWRQTLDERN